MPKTPAKADTNNDGHISRSEAKGANLVVTPGDLNDDGRITRSEAAKMAKTRLGPPKFVSMK
jgi:hypothetical protein|tara:strand:- start:591 stop:776 length:186 start_codon:yes stop_codon:yes gene_type:complete